VLDFKEVVKKLPEQESNCIICAFCLRAWRAFQRGEKAVKCKPECLMERKEFRRPFGCWDYIRRVELKEQ